MGLTNDERTSLIMLRMEKAKRFLAEAEQMLPLELWDMAANRFYYSCFHATQALLVCYGLSAHTHAGTLGVFGMHFIKNWYNRQRARSILFTNGTTANESRLQL